MKRDILYVDDEPDNLVVFEAAFEDDFRVHTAGSGREALDLLERTPVPVVVADQRMPGMTGVELLDIVRQKHPHARRILLTGYADPDAVIEAINKGRIFHFVKKPWERHELMSILVRALETHDLALANSALTDRLVVSERCALLGRATARVAHEMGNQLCLLPLLGVIEEKYSDDPQLVKIGRFARETYSRLAELVAEVKAFMRMETGEFARHPMSLAEAVNELASFLRFDSTVPHDRFELEIRAEPAVVANKVKLQQVLVNLIRNAAHAIREQADGRIVLSLDAAESDAVLRVTDNGCGMTAETLARIWEPFFTTKGAEGNGLGLDISRQLIEGHGGRIACDSTPGVGTMFEIRLPVAAGSPMAAS